jgi:hypothetical protein
LRRNLEKGGERFFEDPKNPVELTKFRDNLIAARALPFPLVLWSVQNRCYEVLQKMYPETDDAGWKEQFRELAGLLSLSVE